MDRETMRIKIYRCPNDCSYGNTGDRCKRCGEWKLYHGEKTIEDVNKYNEECSRNAAR